MRCGSDQPAATAPSSLSPPRPAPRAARPPAPARTRTGRRPTSRVGPVRCVTCTRRTAAHRYQLLAHTPGHMHTHPAYGGSGLIRASSSRHAAVSGPGVLGCSARDRAGVHVARSVAMASICSRALCTQLVKHAFSMADSARRAAWRTGGGNPRLTEAVQHSPAVEPQPSGLSLLPSAWCPASRSAAGAPDRTHPDFCAPKCT